MRTLRLALIAIAALTSLAAAADDATGRDPYPLMGPFIGLNGHTFQVDPELFAPVAGAMRDYHNVTWDVGDDTSAEPIFPLARVDVGREVNWVDIYRSWQENGFYVDASIQFSGIEQDDWTDPQRDSAEYARAFAEFFGSRGEGIVDSMEIGNEPGFYDDRFYRQIFIAMTRAIRQADPEMTIVTGTMTPGDSHRYAKSLSTILWLDDLYDVINIHVYAYRPDTPVRRRTYPEDTRSNFLKEVEETFAWRDQYAPGKPIWVTEFGWDATDQLSEPDYRGGVWESVTDLQQAQYIVRTYLLLSEMGVQKAMMFYYDDSDGASNHAASGLTRFGEPRPVYFAQRQLYQALKDFRFDRIVEKTADEFYVYQYAHGDDPAKVAWVAWFPTGSSRRGTRVLGDLPGELIHAEAMVTTDAPPEAIEVRHLDDGRIQIPVSESPTYLFFRAE